MDEFSDRGSIPLTSTTESTSNVDKPEAGSLKGSCVLSSKSKKIENEFLKLITASKSRSEINRYLYKVETMSKYLPQLDISGQIGRKGQQYSKIKNQ